MKADISFFPYDSVTGGSLFHRLIAELSSGGWTRFRAAVAFARNSGNAQELIKAMVDFAATGTITLTFGADTFGNDPGTDLQAVEQLVSAFEPFPNAHVYLYRETGRTFHPKIYLFDHVQDQTALLIIGSSNWSYGGLAGNIENNLFLNLDLNVEEQRDIYDKVAFYFANYWTESCPGGEQGKGFARLVSETNIAIFAPLLRDLSKVRSLPGPDNDDPTNPSPSGDGEEFAAADRLFNGSKVRLALPFTFPRAPQAAHPGSPPVDRTVLVSEIAGPGRWSQANFPKKIFDEFFGGGQIELFHLDGYGTVSHEIATPITKQSSNYCYELGAASGLAYPNPGGGRPIGVFVRLDGNQFQYRLMMPSAPDYAMLDGFLTSNWTPTPGRLRRVMTTLNELKNEWTSAPFP